MIKLEHNKNKSFFEFKKEEYDEDALEKFYYENPKIKPSFLNNIFYSKSISLLYEEKKRKLEQERIEKAKKEEEEKQKQYEEYLKDLAIKEKEYKKKMDERRYRPGFFSRLFFPYESHCFKCYFRISSKLHLKCKICKWYICAKCDSCGCNYSRRRW